MTTTPKPHILILGAGVTGLQTALSILQTKKYTVTIIAADLPPPPTTTSVSPQSDQSPEYTSPWAGAIWRSHVPPSAEKSEVRAWDATTYKAWLSLLAAKQDAAILEAMHIGGTAAEGMAKASREIGLSITEARMAWSTQTPESLPDGKGIWWRDVVRGFRVFSEQEVAGLQLRGDDPTKKVKGLFAARYDAVIIDVLLYLAYLLKQIRELGGEIIQGKMDTSQGVAGVVKSMRQLLLKSKPGMAWEDVSAVVLAPGLAARHFLPSEEAQKLFPIRGQTVLVKGVARTATTHIFGSSSAKLEDETTYIIPRSTAGITLIGGTKQVGNYDTTEDKGMTPRILERAKSLAPELLNGNGDLDVLKVQVGLRPARQGGPRVELEKDMVEGVNVVYAYGHGGSGYENSVGSAEKVVRLLTEVGQLKAKF